MFKANPKMAMEPIFLHPSSRTLALHLNRYVKPADQTIPDGVAHKEIIGAKAIRYRAIGADVFLAYNQDPHKQVPVMGFLDDRGEVEIHPDTKLITFSLKDAKGHITLYLEIA